MQEMVEALVLAAAWDLIARQKPWASETIRRAALDLILAPSSEVTAEDLRKATGVDLPQVLVMSKDRGWSGW